MLARLMMQCRSECGGPSWGAAKVLMLGLPLWSGCAPVSSSTAVFDADSYREGLTRLAELRAEGEPLRTDSVTIELDAPYLPGALSARGAVAVKQPDGLRMILLGPAGTTAMDLWLGSGRYRFAVPALDRRLTGALSSPAATRRGLPVDFLRWWMLEPFAGRLLAAGRNDRGLELLLEEQGRITELMLNDDGSLSAHRRWWTDGAPPRLVDEETLTATGTGCATVDYHQKSINLTVKAVCERRTSGARDAAFVEPKEDVR